MSIAEPTFPDMVTESKSIQSQEAPTNQIT